MKLLVKALLSLFLLSTYKTLPGAYVIRFYYRAFVTLALTRKKYVSSKKQNTFGYTGDSKLDIFKPSTYTSYVSPLEIDMFVHKSNSTYFTDLDLARMDLVLRVFQKYFFQEFDNDFGTFKSKSVNNFPYAPIAMVECTFKKELKIFQKFEIKSKVVAWDDKWLFMMSEFKIPKSDRTYAVAMTKYVFKKGGGRTTINPEEMIERCGMLNDEVKAINKENYELVKHLASTDDLEAMFDKLTSRTSKL
ncbi:hypothetical protein PGUG_02921 [Meyerozyma guilliermondii ATCC 6260]|uniref:Thioesterase domain-containing protein n=1 Tax=Meyerozyma guilliermondii (strain ATCC 6260 / CBS 566 / DSM 6381 / JCM 1539 / NBRC 10279 / NRRL Y-324) TaxID=294746 RepID=A5DI20_PICGU|nr:uncharacterized protein PGUG_02921 [Meyerozyma guilliermondii ATCC 6260]EDK38823.2 hypothetical protein PGUG_02921 [Meyerozyma guilliermondii ATCC 6260]